MGLIDDYSHRLGNLGHSRGSARAWWGAIVQFGGGILTFFLIGHYYPLLAISVYDQIQS